MASYDKLRLEENPNSFILDPILSTGQKEVLYIPRDVNPGAPINFTTKTVDSIQTVAKGGEIYGLIGIIHLLRGPYLIVITGRTQVARLRDRSIWQLTKYRIIPFSTSAKMSAQQQQDEERYLSMISTILNTGKFYFSHGMDITRRLQSNDNNNNNIHWSKTDIRYFWNKFLVDPLLRNVEKNLEKWIQPIMMGFVQSESAVISNKRFDYILISRRNWRRAGTRYNVRGIDVQGNVANNVETEQIVSYDGHHVSFVVVRGSIPVYWSQKANLAYKPKPLLTHSEADSSVACKKHLDELFNQYGHIVAVNLIDHKGPELALGYSFEGQMRSVDSQKLKYVAYDFHKEVKGMKYERLSLLLEQIKDDINSHNYYLVNKDGNIVAKQKGAVRVNCVDNLDRTNVVQSIVARYVLNQQLVQLGILQIGDQFNKYDTFEKIFKNIWANNGDAMSTQYTGTGALKADFTRTGKRSTRGALDDGVNSLKRYYYNNFTDGQFQDAYDLFLGNYIVDRHNPSPFVGSEKETQMFFIILLVLFVIIALVLFTPTADFGILVKLTFLGFWILIAYLGVKTLFNYGPYIVNNPRLVLQH